MALGEQVMVFMLSGFCIVSGVFVRLLDYYNKRCCELVSFNYSVFR